MKFRLFDIEYCNTIHKKIPKNLPTEIVVDLSKYKAQIGFGNLNYKSHQAILDVTGYHSKNCKAEIIK